MMPGLKNIQVIYVQRMKAALTMQTTLLFKAAQSVTFDIFILKIMFLFFKNTLKILKFRYTFYLFRNN